MKKIVLVMLIACLMVVSGCSSADGPPNYSEQLITVSDTLYATSYDQFSGTHEIPIFLENPHKVLVEVETFKGSIDIFLYDSDDLLRQDPYLEVVGVNKNSGENSQFQVEGELESGSYTLVVRGNKHEGGFGISYG